MTKKDFRRCLELCTMDNHFLFNGKHFVQHEGFAMGNPLSATMANVFLSFHERKWLNDCPPGFRPLVYKRYVDYCFLIFKEKEHSYLFLEYLNKQHANIKFTMEEEENNKLNFIDYSLSILNGIDTGIRIITSVFRKLTFTGLGMNFHSDTYFNFKLNNIRTLLHRAFSLSSSWDTFHCEVEFLTKYFLDNAFPRYITEKIIRYFLDKKFSNIRAITVGKMPFYHKMPFINNYTCRYIKKTFIPFLRQCYPQVDFNFIFCNTFTIKSCLRHKERLPMTLESGIVYLYSCGDCNATYIGSSVKALKTRASEHFAVSSRTGNYLSQPTASRVRDHLETCKYNRSFENFRILDMHNESILLRMSETYEIQVRKPNLNSEESSYPMLLM